MSITTSDVQSTVTQTISRIYNEDERPTVSRPHGNETRDWVVEEVKWVVKIPHHSDRVSDHGPYRTWHMKGRQVLKSGGLGKEQWFERYGSGEAARDLANAVYESMLEEIPVTHAATLTFPDGEEETY